MKSTGSGTYAIVKNSDGSYTVAANWGRILNTNYGYHTSINSTINNFPNTSAINALNLQLVNQAINLKMMAESSNYLFNVYFTDPDTKDTIVTHTYSNLASNVVDATISDSPASNTLEGQTTVKVHYVSLASKDTNLSELTNSYGFPAGSTYGTPNDPVSVSPKTITGYSLVTDSTKLANFATTNSILSANVLATSTSLNYPTGSGSVLDVYYVYDLTNYTVSFNTNGGSTVSNQTISHGSTATRPATNPTKPDHLFNDWYSNPDLTGDPYDFNSPITSNLTLYAKWTPITINLTLDTNSVDLGSITPSTTGSYTYAANTATVTTNNPTGYTLSISTNKASTNPDSTANPNSKALKHLSLNEYIASTANTCTWNNTTSSLTNTNSTLANNTWGFTLTSTNRDSQKLCQVPDKDNPLTIKQTVAANETGDSTTIFFGARVNLSKPSGTYQTVVTYTVVAGT
jgi:uncharacterized repeat protein (TIGR02543 family)